MINFQYLRFNVKGKLEEGGYFLIKRRGEWRDMMCAFAMPDSDDNYPECGDHCPLFGEPIRALCSESHSFTLDICQGRTLRFDEFADERE